ncbi:hypothetical protein [Paenibacillus sp. YYML68]|uniref:hypothetical protein n=1 Tax=Paenibacillus sp. YYML68 TaxID=2909250 RepID=UPI0024933829|nr:hypothetical protein [Paenibacillus sp. YYML68]
MQINAHSPASYSTHSRLEKGRQHRNVNEQVRAEFQAIVSQREQSKALNAKQFMATLTLNQLETLRVYHGQASPIHVTQLTEEGAWNLVVHDDQFKDLDGDGNYSVGRGELFLFPPPEAPSEVHEAYAQLSEDEQLAVYHAAAAKQHVHQLAQQDSRIAIQGKSLLDLPDFSYGKLVDDLLDFLELQGRYESSEEHIRSSEAVRAFKEALEK